MDLSGKNALVTGGAGFIGSALTEALLGLGCRVVVLDCFDDFYQGKEENLVEAASNPRFRLVRGSVLDEGVLDSSMKGADVVFHMAAQAGVRYCLEHPQKAHLVNSTGTFNVLQAAKKHGVPKVVYASSSSVYGNAAPLPMDEGARPAPGSPYAASKLAGEEYCVAFAESYKMDVVCLRYFSVYGPRGRPDQVVTSFTGCAMRGVQPTIYGDGSAGRDFTYVSDVVEATILGAQVDGAPGEVMNVGFGKEVKIGYVADSVLKMLGSTVGVRYLPSYSGDFERTICSNAKATRMLGWSPRVGFDEGLKRYIDWAKLHGDRVRGATRPQAVQR